MHIVLHYECPFLCVSLLLVPFRPRWFHLQTSEMLHFVTIAIATVIFNWAMVLYAQFFPMNFLFFVSFCCWVHLVPGGSSLFKVVPACSIWLQLIAGGFSSFQVVPACSRSFLVLICTLYISHWFVYIF